VLPKALPLLIQLRTYRFTRNIDVMGHRTKSLRDISLRRAAYLRVRSLD